MRLQTLLRLVAYQYVPSVAGIVTVVVWIELRRTGGCLVFSTLVVMRQVASIYAVCFLQVHEIGQL